MFDDLHIVFINFNESPWTAKLQIIHDWIPRVQCSITNPITSAHFFSTSVPSFCPAPYPAPLAEFFPFRYFLLPYTCSYDNHAYHFTLSQTFFPFRLFWTLQYNTVTCTILMHITLHSIRFPRLVHGSHFLLSLS